MPPKGRSLPVVTAAPAGQVECKRLVSTHALHRRETNSRLERSYPKVDPWHVEQMRNRQGDEYMRSLTVMMEQ